MGAEASKAAEPEAEEVEVPETPLDLLMKVSHLHLRHQDSAGT